MKKVVLNIILVVCVAVFIGCGIYLFKYYWDAKQTSDELGELTEMVVEDETIENDDPELSEEVEIEAPSGEKKKILKRYKKLYKKNKDMIGWIKIDDTPINYPVMFTPDDNEYYLHRNFEKQSDVNGLPFLDAKCDPDDDYQDLLVYGHHMKSGMMFKHLMDFESESFYKKHKIVKFDTLYDRRKYEIVAAFRSQVYKDSDDVFKYYEYKGHLDEERFNEYVKGIKKLALYDTGITPQYGDQLLSLVTCAYHVSDGRFVVVARRIDE